LASSVTAIAHGLDYQAYLFWTHAARLLIPSNEFHSVGFELESPKSFDDVAVFHRTEKRDCRGDEYNAEYFQVKYHVDKRTSISAEALIDPEFIGATSESFLQKVARAAAYASSVGQKPKFFLVSPWTIDNNDSLGSLIGGSEGEILFSKLQDGTTDRSAMGQVRKLWREHLNLKSDEDLFRILRLVRIRQSGQNLDEIKRNLKDVLELAGLHPLNDTQRTDPYPQLIRKLRAEGKIIFEETELREICDKENLVRSVAPLFSGFGRRIGIRSFFRFAEDMQSETDRMISLLHHFNNRPIKDSSLWKLNVLPEIKELIESELANSPKTLEFQLDTHMTCAFIAGYFLDTKSGVDVAVLQKTMASRQLWRNTTTSDDAAKARINIAETVTFDSSGDDEAIAISITQMTFDDVISYLKLHVPKVAQVVRLEIAAGAGNTRVEGGGHATMLAEQIRNIVKARRAKMKPEARLHLFISAPNAVVFFLGRLLRPLGRIQLYEHSFDGSLGTAYSPSVELSNEI
jgi:hypothetical protein